MTTLYVWSNTDRTGHVSIEFGDRYVSFHPNLSNDNSLTSSQIRRENKNHSRFQLLELIAFRNYLPFYSNIDEDYEDYGDPLHLYSIGGLDLPAMQRYDDELISKLHPHYGLHTSNCSHVVSDILLCGCHRELNSMGAFGSIFNSLRYSELAGKRKAASFSGRLPETITSVLETSLMHASRQLSHTPNRRLKAGVALLSMVDLLHQSVTWTPGDVIDLAESIDGYIKIY